MREAVASTGHISVGADLKWVLITVPPSLDVCAPFRGMKAEAPGIPRRRYLIERSIGGINEVRYPKEF